MPVSLKRAYDKPSPSDGKRVLVDRLWPRGITKEAARIDEWMRNLAPSNELRKWYHARPTMWTQFRKMYLKELADPEALAELEQLYALAASSKRLTLVYASRNEERNNATVLKELLEGLKKPPSSSGPGATAMPARQRARAKR